MKEKTGIFAVRIPPSDVRPRHFAFPTASIPDGIESVADSGEALALNAEREWSAYHVFCGEGASIELVPPEN